MSGFDFASRVKGGGPDRILKHNLKTDNNVKRDLQEGQTPC
jgi:hypothetical protein